MPMNHEDLCRERFLNACATFDALGRRTYAIRLMRDGGYAWAEHVRALEIAKGMKTEALRELKLARLTAPRSRPVRLR